jgi:hypothetical protein
MQKVGSCGKCYEPKRLSRAKLHQNVNSGQQTGMLLAVLLRNKLWRVGGASGRGI